MDERPVLERAMGRSVGTVLVVDDDADVAGLVEELLGDECYAVSILRDRRLETVRDAVERLCPDCVLLDGDGTGTYGDSWTEAAWMSALPAPVPVIMFSGDTRATDEADENLSERSQTAGFSAVLSKPFDLDELLRVVELAISQSPFRGGA